MWMVFHRLAPTITAGSNWILRSDQLFPTHKIAKMLNSSNSGSSTSSSTIQVIPSLSGNLGRLELNNPSGFNAINLDMVRSMNSALSNFCISPTMKATLLIGRPYVNSRGETRPVFCAGGDVKSLYRCATGKADTDTDASSEESNSHRHGYGTKGIITADFFREEYALNHAIATQYERTKIPQISIWDGITMGGGVGVSIHGTYRVATENTIFAMPETSIGFFPDVGGLWFLSRFDKEHQGIGMYLALTGWKLTGTECTHYGLSTHYVPSKKLTAMYKDLVEVTIDDTNVSVRDLLDQYNDVVEIEGKIKTSQLVHNEESIHRSFYGKESVEEIVASLMEETTDSFSIATLKTLQSRSPTSLKVTFEGMRRASQMDNIGECLRMEFCLSQAFMRPGSDFYEGIRAVLVDKDNQPKWNPSTLEDISKEQVESFFASLGDNDWEIPQYSASYRQKSHHHDTR
jgi:3-hydroxyisobutyryl-CoA hydrolase